MIDEFEKGILCTEAVQTDARFGAVHYTLTVKSKATSEPPSKKPNHTVVKFTNG